MRMASERSSASGGAGSSGHGFSGSPKPKINRVRTGCLTCRRRRKRCDESRPACNACMKTNVFCEGYPPRTLWGTRAIVNGKITSKSKATPLASVETLEELGEMIDERSSANLNLSPLQKAGTYDIETLTRNGEMIHWLDVPMLPQSPAIYFDQHDESFEDGVADADYNSLYQPPSHLQGLEEHLVSSTQPISALKSHEDSIRSLNVGGNRGFEFRTSEDAARPCCVPSELPFLIPGLETALHRRLFYHFTHIMSRVLTTSNNDSNPMNSIVTPLALADPTLMQTLLCLSCSHLLKLQPTGTSPQMHVERYRLHERASHTQTQRVQELKDTATAIGSQALSQGRDAVFATSLLLCLYETCEGTGGDGWRVHLQMARELLGVSSTSTMNPFLLEFFLYHDSLAMVTVPSSAPSINCPRNFSDLNPSLVGVQDGLIEYVTRISSLRSEAAPSSFPPKYGIINKALQIWEDLFRWKPKVTLCEDRKLIAHFYQWALFIWLFSIVYPDGKSDPVIQSAVKWMAVAISEIKSGDGAMAVLLFPLFVVGSAAIRQEDRNAVTKHFKRVRAWSGFGNVDLTFELVKKMWDDHDAGQPRSWDWVIQLEKNGMSLLVT